MSRQAAFRRGFAGLCLAGLLILFVIPASAAAAVNPFEGACSQPGAGGPACSAPTADPLTGQTGAINRVIGILALVTGIVSVIFVIWGGIKYITSNGDSSQVSTAKQTIIYALVGLLAALVARPLINFVLGRI